MNNIKSSEELFLLFVEQANNIGLDTKLWPTIDMYFESLESQSAWMLFARAYMLGIKDGTDDTFNRIYKK